MPIERTEIAELVETIFTNPKCWRRMVNDSAPSPEAFLEIARERRGLPYMAVLARADSGMIAGVFLLFDMGEGSFDVHFCFLPKSWGIVAHRCAMEFPAWVWDNVPRCRKLIGRVPSYNRLAHKLASIAGFTEADRQPGPSTRRGKAYELIVMEMEKPQ